MSDQVLDSDLFSIPVIEKEKYKNASIFLRYCNGIIDVAFIYFAFTIILSFGMKTKLFNTTPDLVYAVLFGSVIFYYFLFEYFLKGRSLGKYITKTRVIDHNGNPPSFGQVWIRIITRYLPFEYFSILIKNDRTTWHDGASSTRVIKISKI